MTITEKLSKWWDNVWYYYKWWIIIGVLVLGALFISVGDYVGDPADDVTVIMATQQSYYKNGSVDAFSAALGEYCPDFDKNGRVRVKIREINIKPAETTMQQLNSLQSKLLAEITLADNVIYIFDKPIYENVFKTNDVLDDLSILDESITPEADKILLKDTGVLDHLDFEKYIKEYATSEFSAEREKYDELYIGIRKLQGTNVENDKNAKKIFDEAYEFLKNILKGR